MRLVFKLTLAIVAAMCAILAVHAHIQVTREVALIESDMRHDHHAMGRAFAAAVREVWREGGEQRAMQLVAEFDQSEKRVRVRWVWLEASADDAHRPQLSPDALGPLRRGREMLGIEHRDGTT